MCHLFRGTNVSRDLFEVDREQHAKNPIGGLEFTMESIPLETIVSLPHDMGVGPNMGVNVTIFG